MKKMKESGYVCICKQDGHAHSLFHGMVHAGPPPAGCRFGFAFDRWRAIERGGNLKIIQLHVHDVDITALFPFKYPIHSHTLHVHGNPYIFEI